MTVTTDRHDPLPLAAPARTLELTAPFTWLRLGWRDLRRAPALGLGFGLSIAFAGGLILLLAWRYGTLALYLGLASGFVFLGPVLAMGMYSVSRSLEQGRRPRLSRCLHESRRRLGNALVFSMILLVVFLVWARAASMVHVFFPVNAEPRWSEAALFLGVGSAVGALFAALIFTFSAFSLPMMLDRKVDAVTAVITSVNAVLRNKGPMALWAAIIVGSVLIGFATALLGFIVTMPLIGHATWHAYRQSIDATAWPAHAPVEVDGASN